MTPPVSIPTGDRYLVHFQKNITITNSRVVGWTTFHNMCNGLF